MSTQGTGTCHTCALRETARCPHPRRAAKTPEIGCTVWKREAKQEIQYDQNEQ